MGLRRRRGRHPRAPAEADRRAGDPPARGSGADAAGRAARRQAQRRDPSEDGGADPEARAADPERPRGAALRRNAEAPAFGPRGRDAAEPARARPLARPPAADRRDPGAAARPTLHRARARRHRSSRARGSGRVAGVPVRDTPLARGARHVEGGARRRRKIHSRAVRGDGHRAGRSRRRRSRSRAGSRRRSRRSGRCNRASSNAPASVPTGCSSIRAFAPAGIFWIFAAGAASSKASSRTSPRGGIASRMPGPTSARRC